MTPEESQALDYAWRFWARANQLPPAGAWTVWLVLAGRGWGKTRTGAEWVRAEVEAGRAHQVALVSDTAADVRDVMIEGDSGLLSVCPPWNRPTYEVSKRRLTWPGGAVAHCYAAEAPELLRGPQHDLAWADEAAKWRNLRKRDLEGGTAWDNLMMGLRVGDKPRCLVTTTPRPIGFIRALLKSGTTAITRGASVENRAHLSDEWYARVLAQYEGTRLGRQELLAEVLEDVPGALWDRDTLDLGRVQTSPEGLVRIVTAIDPAVTAEEDSDETGLVVAGLGADGHGYLLADGSGRYHPDAWARQALALHYGWHGDRVVAEVNNGGDLVEHTLRTLDPQVPYTAVRASRGKQVRAEPIAALYEQGRVHHVGSYPALEDQLCTWTPGMPSPDRLDALVWAFTELMLGPVKAEMRMW